MARVESFDSSRFSDITQRYSLTQNIVFEIPEKSVTKYFTDLLIP
jgi:hypothetical protein